MRPTITLAIVGFALTCWHTAALAQAEPPNAENRANLKSAAPKSSLSTLRSSNLEGMAKVDMRGLKANARTNVAALKGAQKEAQRGAQPIAAERADLAVKKAFASSADAKGMVRSLRGPSGLSSTMPSGTATKLEKDKDVLHKFR